MHTRAQFSTTQRLSVGALAVLVGWVQVQPTMWVMVQAKWATTLQQFHSALAAQR
jgi:hypothetical protein